VLVRRDGEHISLLGLSSLRAHAAPKRTLAMGIFEPLIEHSDGKPPPRHPLDVMAPILVLLLTVVLLALVLLVWGG
jgi:hypothetical protein